MPKVYDTAQTPYQRLVKSGILTEDKKRELASIYAVLSPVKLLRQTRQVVEQLWTLPEPPPLGWRARIDGSSITSGRLPHNTSAVLIDDETNILIQLFPTLIVVSLNYIINQRWGSRMRVIIYGAGAIGSVVGGHLAHADSQVVLIGRPGHVKIVSERGLRLLTPTGTYLVKAPAVTAPSQVSFRPDDVVFLCVKSQDTDGALRDLKQAIGDVPIFCFQNGVCNEGNASRYFSRVYGVRVRLGAVFLTEGEAISLSSPPGWLIMGRYPTGIDDLLEAVAANLRNAGFDILLTPDVMPYKWGKLMLNLGNAVGALSSEKSDSSNLIRISRAARQEAQDILSQAGISIRWATDEEEKQQWPQRKPLLGTLSVEAKDSTWQSLARRKGTVEADFLNGEIVRLARQIGKQAPINETLLRLVNEVAAKRELPGKYTSAELLQLVGLR